MAMDNRKLGFRTVAGAGIGVAALCFMTLGGTFGQASPAKEAGIAEPLPETASRCRSLATTKLDDVEVVRTEIVSGASPAPDYCHVQGVVSKTIKFDLKLPLHNWNSKFYMAGCGGFCGVLDTGSGREALQRNYAVVSTDTGHTGQSLLDTNWVPGNPSAVEDFAHRGVSMAAKAGKAVTRAFYGTDIRRSYFDGCSNGGRQGLMEATRHPEDFDGIIAGAPGFDIQGGTSLLVHISQADMDREGKPILDPAKVGLITQAVAKTCGDKTGLVTSPLTCRFKPEQLQCRGATGPNCLSKAEVAVLNKWYSPPRLKNGKPLFVSGVVHGSEPFWYHRTPYSNAVLGDAKMIATSVFRNLSPDLPADTTIQNFDPETQTSILAAALKDGKPSSDLRKFKARDGKLLIYHGWADPTLPPARTIVYYQDALRSLGKGPQDTTRLFMIPGLSHCANPPGIQVPGFNRDGFDPLTTLENWVEKGEVPAAMLGTKFDADRRVKFTRPICAYPATARYLGRGDEKDASNWSCKVG